MKILESLKISLDGISKDLPDDIKQTARLQFLVGHLDRLKLINIHSLRDEGIDVTDDEFAKILLHRAARRGVRPQSEIIKY